MKNIIIDNYKKSQNLSYILCSGIFLFIASKIFVIIFLTNIPKTPNIQISLSSADFTYNEDSKKNGSDFISYGVQNYFLGATEKPVRLNSNKTEKLTNDLTLFIDPVFIRFVGDDLCNFRSTKALYYGDKSYLEIDNKIKMDCVSGNHGTTNELYGYTDTGDFYGNKGIDLWQDGMRFIADKFIIKNSGEMIDLIGSVKIYFYDNNKFENITATVTSDKLHYDKQTNIVDLYDNVKMINNDGVIDGQFGKCFLKKMALDYMIIKDKVKYTNGQNTDIFGDEMRYYKDNGLIDIEGNVLMKNESAISKAPYFAYDINSDVGKFITENEYMTLKEQYPTFTVDVIRYIIYANEVNTNNKAVKKYGRNKKNISINDKFTTKSRIRIKT
jgi:hypothetical protein